MGRARQPRTDGARKPSSFLHVVDRGGRWAGAVAGPTVRRGQPDRSRANHDSTQILSVRPASKYMRAARESTDAGYR
jgi:hypothetical protein